MGPTFGVLRSTPLPTFVYFARIGEFVKIGASKQPAYRVSYLHTDNKVAWPSDLDRAPATLICYVHGGFPREAEFHARLAASRDMGEWFALTPEVLAVLEAVEAEAKIVRAEEQRHAAEALRSLSFPKAAS